MNDYAPKDDALIIAEAIRLVNEGVSVSFPVNGRSMLPFIVGGRDSVILEKPTHLRRGDIVLASVKTSQHGLHYVVHRIVALDSDSVTLMGDGNLALRELCNRNDIHAKVIYVVKPNGKKLPQSAFYSLVAAKIWYILLPFRRYLLWIYNKVKK